MWTDQDVIWVTSALLVLLSVLFLTKAILIMKNKLLEAVL